MKTNEAGIELIKQFEGVRLTAYLCPANVWTIGYGHTSAAGAPAVAKGMKISKAEADEILRRDLVKFEQAVAKLVKRKISDNAFSALVSLAFNIGGGALAKSSVIRFVNAGNMDKAAKAFGLWVKAGGKTLPGLVRRRAAESALFLTPDDETKPEAVSNGSVEAESGKPAVKSTTNAATVIAGSAGTLAATAQASEHVATIRDSLGITPAMFGIALAAIIIMAGAYVIYQRHRKAKDEGV